MAMATYTITLTRRDVASLFWPAAMLVLRDRGLFLSPRAWLLVVSWWLHLRFGGEA
jgi:hypothetical protein